MPSPIPAIIAGLPNYNLRKKSKGLSLTFCIMVSNFSGDKKEKTLEDAFKEIERIKTILLYLLLSVFGLFFWFFFFFLIRFF